MEPTTTAYTLIFLLSLASFFYLLIERKRHGGSSMAMQVDQKLKPLPLLIIYLITYILVLPWAILYGTIRWILKRFYK
jgi:hypothetical protein